jgi:FkbM family methyltransferase
MRLDWQLYKSLAFGIYEPNVVTAIQQNLHTGMVAVDCGAHIGYHTLLMAKRVGKAGRVYAFEPLPENFSVLCENIRLNGYEGIVVAENKAVGARTGRQRFRRVEHPDESHPFTPLSRLDPQGDLEVEVVALDDYFADRRVDFLKIDCRGGGGAGAEGDGKDYVPRPPYLAGGVARLCPVGRKSSSASNHTGFQLRRHISRQAGRRNAYLGTAKRIVSNDKSAMILFSLQFWLFAVLISCAEDVERDRLSLEVVK